MKMLLPLFVSVCRTYSQLVCEKKVYGKYVPTGRKMFVEKIIKLVEIDMKTVCSISKTLCDINLISINATTTSGRLQSVLLANSLWKRGVDSSVQRCLGLSVHC